MDADFDGKDSLSLFEEPGAGAFDGSGLAMSKVLFFPLEKFGPVFALGEHVLPYA